MIGLLQFPGHAALVAHEPPFREDGRSAAQRVVSSAAGADVDSMDSGVGGIEAVSAWAEWLDAAGPMGVDDIDLDPARVVVAATARQGLTVELIDRAELAQA